MQLTTKRPGYWSVYHSIRRYDFLKIFKVIETFVNKAGDPWEISERGRPPKILPKEYARLLIFMAYTGMSYRILDNISSLLIGKRVAKSDICWAIKRIPISYVKRIYKLIHELIDCNWNYVYITDSTGIETDRYEMKFHKIKRKPVKQYLKWHIIVKYFYEQGLLSIPCSEITDGYKHDSPVFRKNFDPELCRDGIMLGDSAYYGRENSDLCDEHNIKPIFKSLRGFGSELAEHLYKQYRGVIEGVFGANETRNGNKTRCRLWHTRTVHGLMFSVVHNLKSYIKCIELEKAVMKRVKISLIIWIYWTNPVITKKFKYFTIYISISYGQFD